MAFDRNTKKMSDAQLVQGHRNGQLHFFDELVNRHEPGMIRYICSFVDENSAHDVMQDTWVAVLKALADGSYKEEELFDKFVKGIAYRQAMKKRRELHRLSFPDEEMQNVRDESLNPEQYVLNKEKSSAFYRTIKIILGKRELRIFVLHVVRGKNFREIALIMGIREDSARGMYRTAVEKINRWFGGGKRLL